MKNLPLTLPPWPDGKPPPDLLIIAGDPSGDEHTALLLEALLQRQPQLQVAALGGPALAQAGAYSLFDLTAHAVVGLVEVLKNYFFFKDLFEQTVAWIAKHQPRAILLVDYPGFNLRLAQRLRQDGLRRLGGGKIALLYYISPQIWAWKARRRFAMAELLDALAVIFPFEPACFADTTLPVKFVGHPFAAAGRKLPVTYAANGPVLLLPGSREAPVARIFPVMLEGFARYLADRPEARAMTLFPNAGVRAVMEKCLAARPELAAHITLQGVEQPAQGRMVLASSGTMSLACALAGIPGAIVYRANPITYLVGRSVVNVPYLSMANLLLKEPAWPEFIQGAAKPAALAARLRECESPSVREQARIYSAKLRGLLGNSGSEAQGLPSTENQAARWLEVHLLKS